MAAEDLERFIHKVRQLEAFVALSERLPSLRHQLIACSNHHDVVQLAREHGFEIGRRWGEAPAASGGHPAATNLLATPCPAPGAETVEVLAQQPTWRLERIHSCLAASPAGFWYDQNEHEWVSLLQGSARLELEGWDAPVELNRGDQLMIPAHQRHRLLATDPDPGTVWLALFWQEPAGR
ncbi:MAG: Nif11 domain/cupin domain-containing protein [Cyanobacteriota bacterium]|nr:Nif11 domain/cupin domain-containing protein [Cyanobacteriota bacterium]